MTSSMRIRATFGCLIIVLALHSVSWTDNEGLSFDTIRRIAVQHEGRVKPLDTVARETMKDITGKESWSADNLETGKSLAPSGDPVDSLLSLMFQFDTWSEVPLIRVKSARLREAVGLPLDRKHFSLEELSANSTLMEFANRGIAKKRSGERTLPDLEQKSLGVLNSIHLVRSLQVGHELRLVPPDRDAERPEEAEWLTLHVASTQDVSRAEPVLDLWNRLEQAYLDRDGGAFVEVSTSLSTRLREITPAGLVSAHYTNLEIRYNWLKPFKWCVFFYFAGFLLWMVSLKATQGRFLPFAAIAVSTIGLLFQTYGFYLRIVISGRAPVTNMYESMHFMAWGLVFFALIFESIYKSKYFGLSATLAAGIIALMAQVLPIPSGIGVLVPVLRSNFWLTTHVLITMLSYSAFAMAWAMGHIVLIRFLARPRDLEGLIPMSTFMYRTLQVGTLFLVIGTILGGVWANYAWGRFWGWDPKETWALICILGYMAILHALRIGWIERFGLAVWSVLAFLLVIMCYYGVNFVLPVGLHSYGAGSGGVIYAALYVLADLLFVGIVLLKWNRMGRPRIGAETPAVKIPHEEPQETVDA